MKFASKKILFVVMLVASTFVADFALADGALVPSRNKKEPGWEGQVVLRGEEREKVKSLPITQRPNRTGHFYGNTIRRLHYRGSAVPLPRDVVNMSYSFIARP